MHPDLALHMMADLFATALMICLPVLIATMAVGLLISIVQVITQVHETSLTFIPKLLTAGIVLIAIGPWMLKKLTQFSTQLWTSIPSMF
jgi:flagellar biosynthetic protein FliQ